MAHKKSAVKKKQRRMRRHALEAQLEHTEQTTTYANDALLTPQLERSLVMMINSLGSVTFDDVDHFFALHHFNPSGSRKMAIRGCKNVWIWSFWRQEVYDWLLDVCERHHLTIGVCDVERYCEPERVPVPITDHLEDYDEWHWLPCEIRTRK